MWQRILTWANGLETVPLDVPVQTPVRPEPVSADADHPLTIPRRTDQMWRKAFPAGRWGMASEYCGLRHSSMHTPLPRPAAAGGAGHRHPTGG